MNPRTKWIWKGPLTFMALIFLFLLIASDPSTTTLDDAESSSEMQYTYLNDFQYIAKPSDIRYPTCQLGTTSINSVQGVNLADMAFLANLAYIKDELVEDELKGWFNFFKEDGVDVKEEMHTVDLWKAKNDVILPVFFRLFNISWFPERLNMTDYFDDDTITGLFENYTTTGNYTGSSRRVSVGIVSIRGTQKTWDGKYRGPL